MAARYCVECGNPVTSSYCTRCGAAQPASPDASEDASPADTAPLPSQLDVPPGDLLAAEPTSLIQPVGQPSAQPWHPFEQPPWYAPGHPAREDPDAGADFMGVSSWQTEPPPPTPTDRRRNAVLGGLAALAVVVLLVVVTILLVRNNDTATPDSTPNAGLTAAATTDTVGATASSVGTGATADAPPATVTVTTETTLSTVSSTEPSAETSTDQSTATSSADPQGGPARDIPCAPGYIVQIASGVDQASFEARVTELRAAGQLPDNVFVANTTSSCAIFASQSNTIVLYAGPFTAPYDGCDARLRGAPDSFIKGTTPETATEYVSCLCPTSVATLPAVTAINQTGVWVGELQRVLGNKLNYEIPDLAADTWGTFTTATSNAVKQFQTDTALPDTGTVDGTTWQALQAAQC